MGFGSDLKNSQEAVLKLQDWELRLLETVKKFMALRIKSDKEYAYTLQNLCNQVDKESTVQVNYVSNVSKFFQPQGEAYNHEVKGRGSFVKNKNDKGIVHDPVILSWGAKNTVERPAS